MNKIPISFDMETADPDDIFTLCFLSSHPKVELVSVTITPGSTHQVGVVKEVLKRLNKNIPVGSKNQDHPKECVSQFHYNWLGKIAPAYPDEMGYRVLQDAYKNFNDLTIVCGASLGNISNLIDMLRGSDTYLNRIVVQGGFAGDSIVPPEYRLDKFNGKETCPTFNLNGNVPAALEVVSTPYIKKKIFVSKNVCHGFIYDKEMHERVRTYKDNYPGLSFLFEGMNFYLKKTPTGKAFHDPLAACVAIDESICSFKEVELYRAKGEWGSKLKDGSNTFISIFGDKEKFEKTLFGL